MTDKNTEGGLAGEAQEQLPAPQFSGVPDGSVSSGSDALGGQGLDVQSLIQSEVARQLQSSKDRRISRLEKGYSKLLDELQGVIPAEVLEQHADKIRDAEYRRRVDEIYEREQKPISTTKTRGNEEWQKTKESVKDIFVKAGLANDHQDVFNSPDYIAFFKMHGGEFADGMDMVTKAASYIAGAKSTPRAVSPAAVAQSPGRSPSSEVDKSTLHNEYQQKLQQVRGNVDAVFNLKKEYRDKGLTDLY